MPVGGVKPGIVLTMRRKKTAMSPAALHPGFTLIEVLVALVILTVGLLALARGMVGLQGHARRAELRLRASAAATSAVERLSGAGCEPASGADSVGPVTVTWSRSGSSPAARISVRAEARSPGDDVVVELESAHACRPGS